MLNASSQENFLFTINPGGVATEQSVRAAAWRGMVAESLSHVAVAGAISYDVIVTTTNAVKAYKCTGSWASVADSIASDVLVVSLTTAGTSLGVTYCIWTGPGAIACGALGGLAGNGVGRIVVWALHAPPADGICSKMMCTEETKRELGGG
jgi:multidrug transporter EmrE-like cation transporter